MEQQEKEYKKERRISGVMKDTNTHTQRCKEEDRMKENKKEVRMKDVAVNMTEKEAPVEENVRVKQTERKAKDSTTWITEGR